MTRPQLRTRRRPRPRMRRVMWLRKCGQVFWLLSQRDLRTQPDYATPSSRPGLWRDRAGGEDAPKRSDWRPGVSTWVSTPGRIKKERRPKGAVEPKLG